MLKLQGQALIATHTMPEDDEDARSVWVILDHSKDATTLFCLNRAATAETDLDVRRRLPDLPEGIHILQGGSMDGFEKHLILVHREPLKMEPAVNFGPKFSISMKPENVFGLEDDHIQNCRIALGFDTWNPQELEEEIREGLWVLRDITHVGGTFFKVGPEELWARLQAQ